MASCPAVALSGSDHRRPYPVRQGARCPLASRFVELANEQRPSSSSRPSAGDIRFFAAAACAGAGLIHFAVAPEHFAVDWSLGAFFALLGLLQVAWSVGVLRNRRCDLLALGAVTNAGAVSLWAYTRTAGAEAIGPVDVVAVALETAVVVLALVLIAQVTAALPAGTPGSSRRVRASSLRRRRPVEAALTAHERHAAPKP